MIWADSLRSCGTDVGTPRPRRPACAPVAPSRFRRPASMTRSRTMWLFDWLGSVRVTGSRPPSTRRPSPPRLGRPRLEALEDRLTPSGGGLLDTTFNGNGIVALPSSVYGVSDVAVQPDGKIVSVGTFRVNTVNVSSALAVV